MNSLEKYRETQEDIKFHQQKNKVEIKDQPTFNLYKVVYKIILNNNFKSPYVSKSKIIVLNNKNNDFELQIKNSIQNVYRIELLSENITVI